MSQSRQLAAIMFTDIVGYTAMMQQNEQKTVAVIKHYNATLEKWVKHFNGQVLNYYGDGSLCIFSSATEAVNCSLELQKDFKTEPVVPLRIGLHIGEVFFEEAKALGDGVNVASRVQSLGQENTILISGEIHDKIKNNASITTVSLGYFDFKNVDKSLEVFALTNEGLFVPQRKNMEGKLKNKNVRKRNGIAALSFILLIVVAFFIYKNFFNKNDKAKVADKSIAVLPFVNMSNDPDQEYFSDGLSEELLNLLAKITELKVIGRTSSFSFKGRNEDLRVIGEKLGVAYLLEGSVRKSGNKIRITAQLISAADGSHLWSHAYDRDMDDIFKVQDEIAGAVVKELKITMLGASTPAVTQNTEAYNFYLQGKYFTEKRDKESLETALQYYTKALAIDSNYAPAWAGLAYVYVHKANNGDIPAVAKARLASEKALQIDPLLSDAYVVQGRIYMSFDWNWVKAGASLKKALDLDPDNILALINSVNLANHLGHFDEAITLSKRAIALDPLRVRSYYNLSLINYYDGKLEEANAAVIKAIELDPTLSIAYYQQTRVLLAQGKAEMALESIQKESVEAWRMYGLTLVYFKLNRKAESDSTLKNTIKKHSDYGAYQIAEAYAYRGEIEQAFKWLERAYRQRDDGLASMKVSPLLKNLHSDARWKPFLKKMKLPVD